MTPLKARCVLVVDDDPAIRLLLVTFLQRRGFRPLEARNGGEALAQMRAGGAELVVMDLRMPEVSGWDVLRARAADPALRRIPVIVISAKNESDVEADVLDKNVQAILEKPFDLDVLMRTIVACLEQTDLPAPVAA